MIFTTKKNNQFFKSLLHRSHVDDSKIKWTSVPVLCESERVQFLIERPKALDMTVDVLRHLVKDVLIN